MKILSTVGGGVRGYASALWWDALEKKIGVSLGSVADLTAGTSVGSIVSAGQAHGLPMWDIANLLKAWGPHVFKGAGSRLLSRLLAGKLLASRPKHNPEFLRAALEHAFGSVSLGSLPVRSLICAYDAANAEFCAIRSWRGEWATLSVIDALLASSAAPGYFPAHVIGERALIDGGVAANDPSLCAVASALADGTPLADIKLIAVSAGAPPVPESADALQEWGLLEWAPHILTTVFDAQIQTTSRLLKFLIPEENQVRVHIPISGVDLDEATSGAFLAQDRAVSTLLATPEGAADLVRAADLLR